MSRVNLLGVGLLQLLFGYEFFDSGWNKLVASNPSFPAGLAANLKSMLQGQSGWYVNFANSVPLQHPVLFGYLVEWGELLAGIGIIASVVYFMFFNRGDNKTLRTVFTVISIASLVGAIFMSLNFWMAAGAPSPLPGQNDPNGEGVTIDIFGPLLAVALIWWNATSYKVAMAVTKGSTAELHHHHHQEVKAS